MRIRPELRLSDQVRISGAQVLVDDYHRRTVGLNFLEDDCTVQSEVPELVGHVAVVTSVPEAVLERAGSLDRSAKLTVVLPASQLHLLPGLLESEALAERTLESLALADTVLAFSMVPPQADDAAADLFMAGLRVGLGLGSLGHSAYDAGASTYGGRLLSALEHIRDMLRVDLSAQPDAERPITPPAHPDILALEKKLITVVRERDALQRKYDALAGSRLGRITLRRWTKKRGIDR